jgi:hypothetical protein
MRQDEGTNDAMNAQHQGGVWNSLLLMVRYSATGLSTLFAVGVVAIDEPADAFQVALDVSLIPAAASDGRETDFHTVVAAVAFDPHISVPDHRASILFITGST